MRDPSGVFKYTEWYYLRALDTRGASDSLVKKQHVSVLPARPRPRFWIRVASRSDLPGSTRDLNLEMALASGGYRSE